MKIGSLKKFFLPIVWRYNTVKNRNQFCVDEFFPLEKACENAEKTKIRFSHFSPSSWNTIKTICASFAKDEKYDIEIIVTCEKCAKQVLDEGLSYIYYDDYDAHEDKPNVLVLAHFGDNLDWSSCREEVELIIVASIALMRYTDTTEQMWKILVERFEKFSPDYYLIDSLLYKEFRNANLLTSKVVEMGNAKYDGIYEACKRGSIPIGWEKTRGKTVFLWAPDHGVRHGEISDDFTLDIYFKKVCELFCKLSDEIVLIFRPHPTFIDEMKVSGYWKDEDILSLRNRINRTSYMIWDDTDTYDAAYSCADAIITDIFCGVVWSALPTLKPICLLCRNPQMISRILYDEILECQYIASDFGELSKFVKMVKNGEDIKLDLRRELTSKAIMGFDGKNGERIKAFIESKLIYS